MKVQVWDTYVHRADGSVIHFDILVEREASDESKVFSYGKEYLKQKGEKDAEIDASQCQFCHIETPSDEVVKDIERQGYHIVEMDDIAANLSENPSRKDYIMHLRGHYPEHRFGDMQGKSVEELKDMVTVKN